MIELDGGSLDLAALSAIVHDRVPCRLAAGARRAMEASRAVVEQALASGCAVYGVTTGFGDLASVAIAEGDRLELQERLLASHAAGMGAPLGAPAVRAMLALRANSLACGRSGVRPLVVDRLLELLNRDLLPVVPGRGSVGASGDLAPLAHLALPLIGRGVLTAGGAAVPASEGLAGAGLGPIRLEAKEGLALINGTQAMTALTALACLEARRLVRVADLVGALSTDALRGTDAAFEARLQAARPHPGQRASAENLWGLLQGSAIRESHRHGDPRIQDPYSVRCMPQVHGAVRDALADVERRLAVEMNSATDNPLVFAETGDIVSGGNFHGEPIAIAADLLAIALAELAAISERRTEKLTNGHFSGLPPFLVRDAGLNSGFMMAQVTAAALVAENRVLAHPASVDSIPTSADKEDHVSMGMGAALKLQEVVANVRRVLAIELLAAAQGIDLLRPLTSSVPLEALHRAVRQHVPSWERDRELAPDLAVAEAFLGAAVDPFLGKLT
jgi:histidine ammonia-lyase